MNIEFHNFCQALTLKGSNYNYFNLFRIAIEKSEWASNVGRGILNVSGLEEGYYYIMYFRIQEPVSLRSKLRALGTSKMIKLINTQQMNMSLNDLSTKDINLGDKSSILNPLDDLSLSNIQVNKGSFES